MLQADDRLQIGIFEIVANDFMEIDAGFATSEILDLLDAIKQLRVIRQQSSALAGGDDLRSAERKAPHRAESAQMPALPSRAQRLRGIFDHNQAVTPGQGHCCIHVRRAAIQAHKHHRAGRRGDCLFGQFKVEAERLQLNVHKDGLRPGQDNRIRGSDHRVVRHDHLVARPDPECL